MRAKYALIPIAAAAAAVGYIALHPGYAIAEPRYADLQPAARSE